MSVPQIKIRTEGFRAIGKAEIIINGITVVAGENGSGKSSISKLLYHLYKTAANYDSLVSDELRTKLRDVRQFLDIVEHETYFTSKDKNLRNELRRELSLIQRNMEIPLAEQLSNWLAIIRKYSEIYSFQRDLFSGNKENLRFAPRVSRLKYIMKDILKLKEIDESKNSPLPFDQISTFVESQFKQAEGKVKSRPTSLFINALRNDFSDGSIPKLFEVSEYDEPIISRNRDSLSIPFSVQQALYIDTPMLLGVEMSDHEHWDEINSLITKSGKSSNLNISNTISNTIIHGDVSINEGSDFASDFIYKRDDGSTYNLLDCATGVKSFGILQLLLKNGSLTDKTLLIIDEPESHLHPQWIIEYARLIVLLNKIVGVKFFIASHNPDMVSAIKHISTKEEIENNLNFYIAKRRDGKYVYDYEHLGSEIDPIFESFNIALERIHQYGA